MAPVHRRAQGPVAGHAVRPPAVSSPKLSSSRAAICSTDSTFVLAAASSMASGCRPAGSRPAPPPSRSLREREVGLTAPVRSSTPLRLI